VKDTTTTTTTTTTTQPSFTQCHHTETRIL